MSKLSSLSSRGLSCWIAAVAAAPRHASGLDLLSCARSDGVRRAPHRACSGTGTAREAVQGFAGAGLSLSQLSSIQQRSDSTDEVRSSLEEVCREEARSSCVRCAIDGARR